MNLARHAAIAETETFRIRPGAPGDLATVIAIDAEVTGIAKPDYWHDLFDDDGVLRGERRYFLVAEATARDADRQIVGFIIGEARAWEFGSPPCGWVFALSVDPESRLAGVGSGLLNAISACFRAAGVNRMRTMLSPQNHLLMAFFRSHGMMAGPYIQLEKELDQDS
jgi:GNAT superfamily N-acetyltransferase